jgi:hypothetical protein
MSKERPPGLFAVPTPTTNSACRPCARAAQLIFSRPPVFGCDCDWWQRVHEGISKNPASHAPGGGRGGTARPSRPIFRSSPVEVARFRGARAAREPAWAFRPNPSGARSATGPVPWENRVEGGGLKLQYIGCDIIADFIICRLVSDGYPMGMLVRGGAQFNQ